MISLKVNEIKRCFATECFFVESSTEIDENVETEKVASSCSRKTNKETFVVRVCNEKQTIKSCKRPRWNKD